MKIPELVSNYRVKQVKGTYISNGWGEGVCTIINELLNQFLQRESFEFKMPKIEETESFNTVEQFQEIELVEESKLEQNLDKKAKQQVFNLIPYGDINEEEYIMKNNSKEGKNSAVSHKSGIYFLI